MVIESVFLKYGRRQSYLIHKNLKPNTSPLENRKLVCFLNYCFFLICFTIPALTRPVEQEPRSKMCEWYKPGHAFLRRIRAPGLKGAFERSVKPCSNHWLSRNKSKRHIICPKRGIRTLVLKYIITFSLIRTRSFTKTAIHVSRWCQSLWRCSGNICQKMSYKYGPVSPLDVLQNLEKLTCVESNACVEMNYLCCYLLFVKMASDCCIWSLGDLN